MDNQRSTKQQNSSHCGRASRFSAGSGVHSERDRRRAAVIAAEMRRLERCLRTIGPMPRTRLAETTDAQRWCEGTFEEAVRLGIREGKLRALPFDWLESTPL